MNSFKLAYSTKEVAYLLNCSPRKVNDLRKQGKLKGEKPGRTYIYSADTIKKYLERGKNDSSKTRRRS